MQKLKEMLMNELCEYEEKAKRMSGGKLSTTELEKIHQLTDTVKNIDKIEMYEEFGEDGESSYARGRGRGRNARRDSMGRYSREGGYSEEGYAEEDGTMYDRGGMSYRRGNQGGSYRGGSSYDGAKEHLISKMQEMMDMAEGSKERRAIEKCIGELEA